MRARWSTHLGNLVVHTEGGVTEQRGVMVRCASGAIGLANTIRELGHEAQLRIWTDAAAARGLVLRSGSVAIKYTSTGNLF